MTATQAATVAASTHLPPHVVRQRRAAILQCMIERRMTADEVHACACLTNNPLSVPVTPAVSQDRLYECYLREQADIRRQRQHAVDAARDADLDCGIDIEAVNSVLEAFEQDRCHPTPTKTHRGAEKHGVTLDDLCDAEVRDLTTGIMRRKTLKAAAAAAASRQADIRLSSRKCAKNLFNFRSAPADASMVLA
jgi:hypothetical protein